MLVLARRVGEQVVIGGDVVLTVVSIQGNSVRLGIAAPDSVRVDRMEIHRRRDEFADSGDSAQSRAAAVCRGAC